ncbi:MAG TPA: type II secretion system protein GspL [Casimicrobiaceae bacterium]|jgi:hypothetical protein
MSPTTLRVLLSDPPQADRACAWALFGADGHRVREGRDAPHEWPPAQRREAVVAASRARLITLALPPLAPERVADAATYALEDQLAATDDPPRVAVSAQAASGRVHAAVAGRELVDALAGTFDRVVPETALAPDDDAWTLYASGASDGFVHTPDGAFAVTLDERTLPAELGAALTHARRGGTAPDAVRVAFERDRESLERYAEAAGVAFVAGRPWRWSDAPPERFDAAPDWRAPARAGARTERAQRAAWFRPALVIAALALALHVGATLAQWAAYRWSDWRIGRATVALAQDAGLADAATPAAAVAALVRQHADARHRAGLLAPGDALPLLAQATPALADLPPGAIKSAIYGDGAWTLDLASVDATRLARVDRVLAERGVAVLQAPTQSGVRLRLTATP